MLIGTLQFVVERQKFVQENTRSRLIWPGITICCYLKDFVPQRICWENPQRITLEVSEKENGIAKQLPKTLINRMIVIVSEIQGHQDVCVNRYKSTSMSFDLALWNLCVLGSSYLTCAPTPTYQTKEGANKVVCQQPLQQLQMSTDSFRLISQSAVALRTCAGSTPRCCVPFLQIKFITLFSKWSWKRSFDFLPFTTNCVSIPATRVPKGGFIKTVSNLFANLMELMSEWIKSSFVISSFRKLTQHVSSTVSSNKFHTREHVKNATSNAHDANRFYQYQTQQHVSNPWGKLQCLRCQVRSRNRPEESNERLKYMISFWQQLKLTTKRSSTSSYCVAAVKIIRAAISAEVQTCSSWTLGCSNPSTLDSSLSNCRSFIIIEIQRPMRVTNRSKPANFHLHYE